MAPESSRCPAMPAPVAISMMRAPISMPGLALWLPLISRTGCGWSCGVELVDQGHTGAGLHVGDPVQVQGPLRAVERSSRAGRA